MKSNGWCRPKGERDSAHFHYFVDGISLCGEWVSRMPTEDDPDERFKCRECQKLAKKRGYV